MKGNFFTDKSSFDNPMELWRESNVPGAKPEAMSWLLGDPPKASPVEPNAVSLELRAYKEGASSV